MNLIFKRIKLENFMSFETAEIILSSNGFVSVVGQNNNSFDNATSNGSGKSAIFEALNWCLTGETLRGSKDIVRIGSDNGALVELEFSLDKDDFVIMRTKNHKKFKTNLFIIKNGDDISGKGIRDTEQILHQHLPYLTSELINSVVILGQGLPMRFTNNTPSGRKEMLESLSNSDFMIYDLKTRIASRKNDLSKQLTSSSNDLIKFSTENDLYTKQLEALNKEFDELNNKNLQDVEDKIKEQSKKADECDKKIGELLHKYNCTPKEKQEQLTNEKFELISKRSKEESATRDAYNVKILEKTKDKAEVDALVRIKSSEVSRLKSITDVCPTCGQKLPDVHKVDTTDLEKELDELRDKSADLQKVIKLLESESEIALETVFEKYSLDIADKDFGLKRLSAELQELSDLQLEESIYLDNIEKCKDELSTHSQRLSDIKSRINEIEEKIKFARANMAANEVEIDKINAKLAVQSKFENSLKRDFRGILLQNCISYINAKAKEYCNKIFHTKLIDFSLDGNNISISYSGKEYESLSGGEKQKIDLIIQFALRDMLCNNLNFSCNLLVLDELTDAMDSIGCKNTIDFISSELNDIDSVFIISHRMDLEIPYDKIITVLKNDFGVSSVL